MTLARLHSTDKEHHFVNNKSSNSCKKDQSTPKNKEKNKQGVHSNTDIDDDIDDDDDDDELLESTCSEYLNTHGAFTPRHERAHSYQQVAEEYRFPPIPQTSISTSSGLHQSSTLRPPKSPLRSTKRRGNKASTLNRQSHYISREEEKELVAASSALAANDSYYNYDRRRPSAPTISLRQRQQDDEEEESMIHQCTMSMSRTTSIESTTEQQGTKIDHQILLDSLKEEEEGQKRKEKERETLSLKSRDGAPSSQFVSEFNFILIE